jgi:uncharacterized protein (TIGR00106 family)
VKSALSVLQRRGLHAQTHAMGTDVEGDLDEVLRAVQAVHEQLHADGAVRIETTLRIETRRDKEPKIHARDRVARA